MSWITVAQTDLENYVVAALVTAINQAALGDSQTDRFTQVQSDVTAMVRMAVASNDANILDEDATTIPQSLRPAACWIIAGFMAQGLKITLSDQQANELQYARDTLDKVARGDLTVETPDSEDTTPDAQGGSYIEVTPEVEERTFTRSTMAGL